MWMARAATSLPVPDSPCTSTVAELPATRASSLYTSSMAALWPTNAYGPTACGSTSGSGTAVSLTTRSEEHTSELQSRLHLVCRLLLEKKKAMRVRIVDDN